MDLDDSGFLNLSELYILDHLRQHLSQSETTILSKKASLEYLLQAYFLLGHLLS